MGKKRHHRRQRRIPVQCRSPGRIFRHRRQPGLRADGAGRHGHLGHRARRSLPIASCHGARKRHRLRLARSRPHRQRHSHHARRQPDIAAHSRRRPHQQPGHDHRLRPRRLRHPRHASHARRPPDQLAPRWHSRHQHRHRAESSAPQFDPKDLEYVEVNRGSYGAEFGDRTYGVFNVSSPHRLRAQQRSRTRPQRRQLLPDQ